MTEQSLMPHEKPKERSASTPISSINASKWSNYLYIIPLYLLVGGLIFYALAYTFEISFYDWNGFSPTRDWVGLENYQDILQDKVFHRVLINSSIYAVSTIFIQMLLGFFLAILLTFNVYLKTLYKIIFFLPVVTAPAVTSYVFRHIYSSGGELNQALELMGLGQFTQVWLADPDLALVSVIAINVWNWTGFSFIMYTAGLTTIDSSIYEAATIDGAGFFQTVRHIIFPLLRPTHFTLMILGAIGALKTFDVVWLTTEGGPGRATELMSTYIFKKGVLEFSAGYSAALSIILLLIALVLTILQTQLYQEG